MRSVHLRHRKTIISLIAGAAIIIAMTMLLPSIACTTDLEDEFEVICSQVDNADNLTIEELQDLIMRADDLVTKLESSSSPRKKILITRLKKCRSFFEYLKEVKKGS